MSQCSNTAESTEPALHLWGSLWGINKWSQSKSAEFSPCPKSTATSFHGTGKQRDKTQTTGKETQGNTRVHLFPLAGIYSPIGTRPCPGVSQTVREVYK